MAEESNIQYLNSELKINTIFDDLNNIINTKLTDIKNALHNGYNIVYRYCGREIVITSCSLNAALKVGIGQFEKYMHRIASNEISSDSIYSLIELSYNVIYTLEACNDLNLIDNIMNNDVRYVKIPEYDNVPNRLNELMDIINSNKKISIKIRSFTIEINKEEDQYKIAIIYKYKITEHKQSEDVVNNFIKQLLTCPYDTIVKSEDYVIECN